MSLRDLHRTTENKALYDGRLTVDLHYTERHGTTRHDKNHRAFASTGT